MKCSYFRKDKYDRLLDECYMIEAAFKEFRAQKNSFIAEIQSLEDQCKDIMDQLLSSKTHLDELRAEVREDKEELTTVTYVDDLVDLNKDN